MRDPASLLELHDAWLRVDLNGASADFHHRWLRHNCPCDRHPKTGERTLCSSEIADDIAPAAARRLADALELTWPDGHVSVFPITWLREHAYAIDQGIQPPRADLSALLVDGDAGDLQGLARAAIARIAAHGAAVRRRPAGAGESARAPEGETEALIAAFIAQGLAVIPTHFGRIEDLRTDNTTNQNTDQLGYTDAPVDLHTDQPFIARPPRYQLLQCIRAADEGGESVLADGLAVYRYLEATDARAAEVLATVPLRFHRKQARFESVVDAPMIRRGQRDGDGGGFMVRASYFTLAPHRVPFAAMTELYRAHDRYVRLLRDPRYHVRVRLRPGEWLIYDNHRCLHARTGFRGARWLRGVYFDPAA